MSLVTRVKHSRQFLLCCQQQSLVVFFCCPSQWWCAATTTIAATAAPTVVCCTWVLVAGTVFYDSLHNPLLLQEQGRQRKTNLANNNDDDDFELLMDDGLLEDDLLVTATLETDEESTEDEEQEQDEAEELARMESLMAACPECTTTAALLQRLEKLRRRRQQQQQRDNKPEVVVETQQIKYLLGFSTGHAGSTSAHAFFRDSHAACGWSQVQAKFEAVHADEKRKPQPQTAPAQTNHNHNNNSSAIPVSASLCRFTRNKVLPFIKAKRQQASVFLDMGHFHNRENTLECLAHLLQSKLALVRIRRNRYQIAASLEGRKTPCLHAAPDELDLWEWHQHKDWSKPVKHHPPSVAYCPHSRDQSSSGVALPVASDQVWNQLTRFQKFLWYADDMEYRWYRLLQHAVATLSDNNDNASVPWFHEVTWSTGAEFAAGLSHVLEEMQCNHGNSNNNNNKPPHKKKHVQPTTEPVNCTASLFEDLDYRRRMNYSAHHQFVLFHQFPQHMLKTGDDCLETPEQLRQLALQLAKRLGVPTDPSHWVFGNE